MTTWSATGRHADRLDLGAELGGPEHRQRQVRPAVRLVADHVVGGDLGLRDRVAPVLEGEELVAVHRVREAGHVAGDEDVVGDQAVDVERRGSPHRRPPPSAPAASPEPSSHSTLRTPPSAATATSTSSVLPSDSRARRSRPFPSSLQRRRP